MIDVPQKRERDLRLGVTAAVGWALRIFVIVAFPLVFSGCGSTGPAPVVDGYGPVADGHYRVRKGDTLYQIARRHGVSYATLGRWNGIGPPYRIYSGKVLRVESPGGRTRRVGGGSKPKTTKKGASTRTAKVSTKSSGTPSKKTKSRPSKTGASGLHWSWPLKGKVVQTYRKGDRTRQGIRIAGRAGQQVLAAEGGTVVYSGSGLKGYGNLIIVKHNNNYLSAYGFNRRLLIAEGARVKRGQGVAEVGQASSGDYQLHFEIRRNGTAEDPLRHLPRSR